MKFKVLLMLMFVVLLSSCAKSNKEGNEEYAKYECTIFRPSGNRKDVYYVDKVTYYDNHTVLDVTNGNILIIKDTNLTCEILP